jgi:hypothetical protein
MFTGKNMSTIIGSTASTTSTILPFDVAHA